MQNAIINLPFSEINKVKVSQLEEITGLKANKKALLHVQRSTLLNGGVKNGTIVTGVVYDFRLREYTMYFTSL